MSDIQVNLTAPCEACGRVVNVPYKWNMGAVVPRPSTVRFALLEWDQSRQDLVEMETSPDISTLLLCEPCRAEFVQDVLQCFLKLQDKAPQPAASAAVVM